MHRQKWPKRCAYGIANERSCVMVVFTLLIRLIMLINRRVQTHIYGFYQRVCSACAAISSTAASRCCAKIQDHPPSAESHSPVSAPHRGCHCLLCHTLLQKATASLTIPSMRVLDFFYAECTAFNAACLAGLVIAWRTNSSVVRVCLPST